jgi:hypothetical protein
MFDLDLCIPKAANFSGGHGPFVAMHLDGMCSGTNIGHVFGVGKSINSELAVQEKEIRVNVCMGFRFNLGKDDDAGFIPSH